MSVITLPQRFLSQPQYAAPIDYAGLGKGVRILFNSGAGPVDLVTGRAWTPTGEASVAVEQRGKVFSFDGNGDYYSNTGYPELTGNVGTFFAWCPRVGAADSFGHILFGASSPASVAFQIGQDLKLYNRTITGTGTLSSWFNTTNRSLILSSGGTGATCKGYLDGVDSGITWSATPTSWGAGNKNFSFGRYSGGTSHDFNGSILIAGLTDAVWGAAEAEAFHKNPWQLFKAPSRRIWISTATPPPSGGFGYVNVGGTWKTVAGTHVNVGGVWKAVANTKVNVSGTWKSLA